MNRPSLTTPKADILVVDDTLANVHLLVSLLKGQGYKVRPVMRGDLALEVAIASPPDLILLDILLPPSDGYTVCEQLKANPITQEIPIIFISALNEGLNKVKAFQVGGVDYISKPFQIEEVIARVDNQLNQLFLRRQLQEQSTLLSQQNEKLKAEITERQILTEKLIATEQKIRAVFEAMTDIVIALSVESGQITGIDILPTQGGLQQSMTVNLIDLTLNQLWDEQYAEDWIAKIQTACSSQQTIHFDYSVQNEEQTFWLAAAISPLGAESAILVARDISDRKQAEFAIQQAEERYHSIVDNALEGIYQASPHGQYLSVNPALAKMYGYHSPEELIQEIQDISQQVYVDPNRRQDFVQLMAHQDSVSGFEAMIYRRDKTLIWISETARSVKDAQGNLLYYEGIVSNITERKIAQEALNHQKSQMENLLLSIFPQPIVERLQMGENPIADQFEEVSVLFADLVGFTELSSNTRPSQLVELLNAVFSQFDCLAKAHQLEKIKTIGDAYMVVGGLPIPRPDAAEAIASMALQMQATLQEFNRQHSQQLQLRIGIHLGPVVAGVIGVSKFIYDLWGDTVNIASRMESSGLPGKIQVTAPTYERLKDQFLFEERGVIPVKGKGEMLTYWLTEYQSPQSPIYQNPVTAQFSPLPYF